MNKFNKVSVQVVIGEMGYSWRYGSGIRTTLESLLRPISVYKPQTYASLNRMFYFLSRMNIPLKNLFVDDKVAGLNFVVLRNEYCEYYLELGLKVRDFKNRVIPVEYLQKLLEEFDFVKEGNLYREERLRKHLETLRLQKIRKEKGADEYRDKEYWRWFRQFRTFPEKRVGCSEEHYEFLRGRRRPKSLPSVYDDKNRCRLKNWKSKTKRRHQWEYKMSTHVETVKLPKNIKEEFDVIVKRVMKGKYWQEQ